LTFRWTSYSLSRTGDRSGEAEGSCAVFFFDFGLRAVALPLPPAGAIVGDRLLEWKFKEGDRFKATKYFLSQIFAKRKLYSTEACLYSCGIKIPREAGGCR
jgi:hypothetical protein